MKFCIRGYEVEFPHQPYGVQFSFMEKMLRTLDEQGNALLEAPTGCGKTLSLLCAALAWQTRRKQELLNGNVTKVQRNGLHDGAGEPTGAACDTKHQGQHAKAANSTSTDDKDCFSTDTDDDDDDDDTDDDDGDDKDFKPPAAAAGGSLPRPSKKASRHGPNPDRSAALPGEKGNTRLHSSPAGASSVNPDRAGGNTADAQLGQEKPPRIFFATRTHSQIAQVVRELKRSGYKPAMAVLAAKQHYCINNTVKRTGRVDEECERLMKEEKHGCRFGPKTSRGGGRPPGEVGVHDIEELSKMCARAKICPYFAARDLATTAELIFCPYTYLLDPLVRSAMALDIEGAVLIFDEAHNMEDVCREGGSMDLDLDMLREVEISFKRAAELTGRPELYAPLAAAVGRLVTFLCRFEASADGMIPSGFEEHEVVWQGSRALALLTEAGLAAPAVCELYRVYEQAKAFEEKATFTLEGDAFNEPIPASVVNPGAGGAAMGTMGRLLTVLRMMYAPAPQPSHSPQPQSQTQPSPQSNRQQHYPNRTGAVVPAQRTSASVAMMAGGFIPTAAGGGGAASSGSGSMSYNGAAGAYGGGGGGPLATAAPTVPPPGRDNSGDYRLVVKRWIAHGAKDRRKARSRHRRDDADGEAAAVIGPGAAVSMGLWCFNPAVAFRKVADQAHSVILTSGTLAPLDSFASELGTEFHIRLEAPHVVDMSRQVWASVIPRGPGGNMLSATYRESGTFSFQDDAGEAILRYCQVIPDGVLLFLPSYGLLEKLMTRWKATGLWSRLESVKTLVVEPREAGKGFEDAMAKYYTAVHGGKGGLFLAVCRGKASEGIDFADQHARGVILLGIPFPAAKDIKVKLKKDYNDAGSGPSSGRPPSQRLLTGDAWYNQQAFRALNQAVGRCIRHKFDWGAIILLDERFRSTYRQQQLSRWVRTAVKVHDDFNTSLAELNAFCKGLMANPPRPPPPLPQPQQHIQTLEGEGSGSSAATAAAAASAAAEVLPVSLAPVAAMKQSTGSFQRGRNGGKDRGKGSVDLQYEEDVVPPLLPPPKGEKAGSGVGGAGRFDRFRLGGTSSADGQNVAVASSMPAAKTSSRHITSFFPVAADTAAVAAAGPQPQALKPRAAEAASSGKDCCFGGGGGGGGAGSGAGEMGGCGSRGQSVHQFSAGATSLPYDGCMRTYNGTDPPLLNTQPATQQYQPPRPELNLVKGVDRPMDLLQPQESCPHQQDHPHYLSKQQRQPQPQPYRQEQQQGQPKCQPQVLPSSPPQLGLGGMWTVPVDATPAQHPSVAVGSNQQIGSFPTTSGPPAQTPTPHRCPSAPSSFQTPQSGQTMPDRSTPHHIPGELRDRAPEPSKPGPRQQLQPSWQQPEQQQASWSRYLQHWPLPQHHPPGSPAQGCNVQSQWQGRGQGPGLGQAQAQQQQQRTWFDQPQYRELQHISRVQPQMQMQANGTGRAQQGAQQHALHHQPYQGQQFDRRQPQLQPQARQHNTDTGTDTWRSPPFPPRSTSGDPVASVSVSTLFAATGAPRQHPSSWQAPQTHEEGGFLGHHPGCNRVAVSGASRSLAPILSAQGLTQPHPPSLVRQPGAQPPPMQSNKSWSQPRPPSQQAQNRQAPQQEQQPSHPVTQGLTSEQQQQQQVVEANRQPHGPQQQQQANPLQNQPLNHYGHLPPQPQQQQQQQQVVPRRSGVDGPGAVVEAVPSEEKGGASRQMGASTLTCGWSVSACGVATAAGCGTHEKEMQAVGARSHDQMTDVMARPKMKRLTSSRAREAANKRQRVHCQNRTGLGPGDGYQEDFEDEEDDFV